MLPILLVVACGNASDDESEDVSEEEAGERPAAQPANPPEAEEAEAIPLESGLGGETGACMFNWCRDNQCHFICLAVPDDRASCDAAIEGYLGIPRQNFLSDEFQPGETCREATGTSTQCRDPFGSIYYPVGGDCEAGDALVAASGRCRGALCVGGECSDFCVETDETGCDQRSRMFDDDPSITTDFTFVAGLDCPNYPQPEPEPETPNIPDPPAPSNPNECSDCLSACRGLPSCCTGVGCICQEAC
jgi:hypothetical protein